MRPTQRFNTQAKIQEAPNLAGQSEIYLVKALKSYRSGARKNDMMSLMRNRFLKTTTSTIWPPFTLRAIEGTAAPPPK